MSDPTTDTDDGRLSQLEHHADENSSRLGTTTILVAAFASVALLASVVGIGLGMRAVDESKGGSAGAETTVEVEIGEFYVTPASIEVAAGTKVVLNVTNAGAMPHDLKVGGTSGTAMLDAGASETVTVGPIDAATEAWCTVPGHKAAGMVMDIKVAGGSSAASGHGGSDAAASASGDATIDFAAAPPVDFVPYDPKLAPAPGGTEHTITMRAIETPIEVSPGVTQELWTFDGTFPGTTLRGNVGDLFTITLVNDGKIGHSIDFHASKVAWNDEMRTIQPGESLVYQYKAEYAGIYMYHCGTAPALHHIGNGMFGAIIINPADLPAVDHEFVLVQSELYLGPEAQPGDLTKMQDESFDAVVFNGYVNQYKTHPIRVEKDQRVRVWVLDAGPNENSAFHIVGTIFDTVYKEGTYLLQPGSERGGSQAMDLQPAQGGFVEFTLAEDGLYPIVTHKFANVGKGALGLFQAGEVAATAGGH